MAMARFPTLPRSLRLGALRALWVLALLSLLPIVVVCASEGGAATIPLSVEGHTLQVEVARSPLERAQGLMFRKEMGADHGMLFAFEEERIQSFWMKNTYLPLSIAFIDRDKRIVNLHDMAPNNSERTYESTAPVLYALEVNQGWFARNGVGVGDVVTFELPGAHAP